jgi:hypothetical protein
MCMIDYGDGTVTLIRDEVRKARKQHGCSECGRTIDPGEKYRFEFYTFDGQRTSHRTCAHCQVVRGWLWDECGGWLYGGVEEDFREHAHEGYYGIDLLRLVVAQSKNWRRPDGSLRPVPKRPRTSFEIRTAKQAAGEQP